MLLSADHDQFFTEELDKTALLGLTLKAVRGQAQFRQSMSRDSTARTEIEDCLAEAFATVRDLCLPVGYYVPVRLDCVDGTIIVNERIRIHNKRMAEAWEPGAFGCVYLVTCGYDSQEAFAALDNDYVLYHFQYVIGRQLLYLAAHGLYSRMKERFPRHGFRRYAVFLQEETTVQEQPDPHNPAPEDEVQVLWDPVTVHDLFSLIEPCGTKVTIHESGSFTPLHTMTGIAMGLPEKGESHA